MDVLRVGLLGANVERGWARQSHLPALRALDGVRIVAVATTRAESAEKAAEQVGAAHAYTSATDLACDPDVDLVTVAVRVPAHADAVTEVIRAGKDVYCEWPLGTSSAQAVALRDMAAAAGVRAVIGLQARVAPAVVQARALVAGGEVGRVLSVQAFSAGMGLGGPVLPADREWAADAAGGLSALSVRAAHTLDAVQCIAGPIAELSAQVMVATPDPRIDGTDRTVRKTAADQVVVGGALASGASLAGTFLLGVTPAHLPLIAVMGTEGTLALWADAADGQIQMNALTLRRSGRAGMWDTVDVSDAERYAEAAALAEPAAGIARMYCALREGSADLPGFADAVRLHRLLDDILASSQAGTRIAGRP